MLVPTSDNKLFPWRIFTPCKLEFGKVIFPEVKLILLLAPVAIVPTLIILPSPKDPY